MANSMYVQRGMFIYHRLWVLRFNLQYLNSNPNWLGFFTNVELVPTDSLHDPSPWTDSPVEVIKPSAMSAQSPAMRKKHYE